MASLLMIVALFLFCYLIVALTYWDSLFHRVWSFALFSLLLSTIGLFYLPLSTHTTPLLSIFTFLIFVLCVALSPVQSILYPTEVDDTNDRALEIIWPTTIDDGASQGTIFAESVLPLKYLDTIMD